MLESLLTILGSGVAAAAGTGVVLWLVREWLSARLKESIAHEYARKFEDYKRELELRFNDQVRLRKLYEDLSTTLEDIWGNMDQQNPKDLSIAMNKLFGLLALYASDDVYHRIKETFYLKGTKTVYAKDLRPAVYHALRKSLFRDETKLSPCDFVDNLECTPLPAPE